MRAVERLTGQPVQFAPVPTAADLRAARLERTPARCASSLEAGADDADGVREMLVELAADFGAVEVAAAAIRMMTEAAGSPDDGEDIPVITPGALVRPARPRSRRGRGGAAAGTRPPKAGTTRLFVNAGRASGVRPQDIVGALANESNLTGRDIGAIQIHERHALVEIPEHAADDVLRSLKGTTTLKGRRANVRRDRGFAGAGAGGGPSEPRLIAPAQPRTGRD